MNMNLGQNSFFSQLSTFKISKDNLSILPSTKHFQHKILELIGAAKKRIYITALYLQDDAAGAMVLKALYEAKNNNPQLDIKIFVDYLRAQRGLVGHKKSVGNVRLYQELNQQYQHPIDIYGIPVKSREFLGVLHLKGFVFDDTLLYSGASINNTYLHYEDHYRIDRYHLIHSAELCDSFSAYLNQNIANSGAVQSMTNASLPPTKSFRAAIRKQKALLKVSAYQFKQHQSTENDLNEKTPAINLTPLIGFGSKKNQLNNTILELIKQTKQEVVIFTPYFNLPKKVNKAVLGLAKKQIKVTIVVGDKTANDFFIPQDEKFEKIGVIPYVYEANLKRFLKSNQKYIDSEQIRVYLWRDNAHRFHLKGINSDRSYYLLTGHNINPRAWRLDIENGILIQDPQQALASQFDDELKLIMANCTKINHFDEIDSPDDYPAEVNRLLKRLKRTRLDKIFNHLL